MNTNKQFTEVEFGQYKVKVPLEPLQVFPDYDLAALTYFHYDVCNDPYNEA